MNAKQKNMSLTFHQTFRLELSNVAKVLACITENPKIDNVGINKATGIGIGKDLRQGKVQPTLDYARFSGLLVEEQIDGVRYTKLSPVGEITFNNDHRLRTRVSHWVMHYHLSRQGSDAEAWEFFIHEFLPTKHEFHRKELDEAIEAKFSGKAILRSINPGVLLSCYIDEDNALGKLRLLRERKRGEFFRPTPNIPNAYLTGYLLAEIWDERHPTSTTVSHASLTRESLGSTLGIDEMELQAQFDELTKEAIIEQMRAVQPFQVVKLWEDKLSLLQKAYDEEGFFC